MVGQGGIRIIYEKPIKLEAQLPPQVRRSLATKHVAATHSLGLIVYTSQIRRLI